MSKQHPRTQNGSGSKQIQVDGQSVSVHAHLTKQEPGKCLGIQKEREWYCRKCGNRVTVALAKDGEWGHALDCKHHISHDIDDPNPYDHLDYTAVDGGVRRDAVSEFMFCDCGIRARPDSVTEAFVCPECGTVDGLDGGVAE